MARGLAKLEGELARVGSWAATRRERQEAARFYHLAANWYCYHNADAGT